MSEFTEGAKAKPDEMLSDEDREFMQDKSQETKPDPPEKSGDILTAEQTHILDEKREILLDSGSSFAVRFVSLVEHLQIINAGETDHVLEANIMDFKHLRQSTGGEWSMSGLHSRRNLYQIKDSERTKRGDFSETWAAIANEFTNWTGSSRQILNYQSLLQEYRDIVLETRKGGGTTDDARIKFSEKLVAGAKLYLGKVYAGKLDFLDKPSSEADLSQKIQEPNPAIDDDDRKRLIELFDASPSEFTRSDLRLLMRYNRDYYWGDATGGRRPFEVMQIWDQSVYEYRDPNLFGTIKAGSSTERLLAVVSLYPDGEYYQKLVRAMQATSANKQGSEHLVISITGEEVFPRSGTDFILFEREIGKERGNLATE